jgi:phosphatidylglycerol:prolipoprotein diacylglycerol transferase
MLLDPIAFEIGPVTISWYGIILSSAFLAGILLAYFRAGQNGVNPDHIITMVTLIIPAAIIGARVYYVAFEWENYAANPLDALAIWHGGLAIHGGLIGGVLAGLWYVRRNNLHLWLVADIVAPSLILGQAIGRWGNFINQEAHGGSVSYEFISHFPRFIQEQMYIAGQYVHPTFLYESAWNLAVFAVLIWRWPRKRFHGEIAMFYLILYSLGRFFIEGLRTDSLMAGELRVAQLVSLLMIAAGLTGLYFLGRRKFI